MHSIFSMHIWVHILYAIKLFKQWVCASTTNLPILGGWQFLCRILRPSILSFFFFVYRFIPFCDCCCCSYCLPRSVACPNTAFKYIQAYYSNNCTQLFRTMRCRFGFVANQDSYLAWQAQPHAMTSFKHWLTTKFIAIKMVSTQTRTHAPCY